MTNQGWVPDSRKKTYNVKTDRHELYDTNGNYIGHIEAWCTDEQYAEWIQKVIWRQE